MDTLSNEKNKHITDVQEIINSEDYECISDEEPRYITLDIGKNFKNYKKFNQLQEKFYEKVQE